MNSLLHRLRVLQDSTFALSNETLASFRIVYFFFALSVRTPSSLAWASEYPDWLRTPPPGLPTLIGVPPAYALLVIQWGSIAFAAMGLVGYRTRAASWMFPTMMIVHRSVEFGFGKIDHDLLWLLVPLLLASSGWGDAFSVDAVRDRSDQRDESLLRNSRAVALLYTFFAVAFFTAAAAKLRTWPDPSFSAAADFVRYYQATEVNEPVLARVALQLPPIVWEAIDYGTIVMESAPLIMLFVPRGARRIVFGLVLFHLGVLLAMGIDFSDYLILYVPLAAHPRAGERFAHLSRRRTPLAWVAIATAALAALLCWAWFFLPLVTFKRTTGR